MPGFKWKTTSLCCEKGYRLDNPLESHCTDCMREN